MQLTNKVILIVSPQPWQDLYISKHHYAVELAKMGNEVYFLQPPGPGRSSVRINEIANIKVIDHRSGINPKIRFHFKFLYKILIYFHLKKILKKINNPIDILWCFEPNVYPNLNWFKSEKTIYHPVDYIGEKHQFNLGTTADLILTVSEKFVNAFGQIKTPIHLINHGLSEYFVDNQHILWKKGANLRFAYLGNLLVKPLDRKVLKRVIKKHSEIIFDFYGIYEDERYNFPEGESFIDFLKECPNCNLLGIKHPKELSSILNKYDGFISVYIPKDDLNACSNSHKILEYLSKGKLIISNKVQYYENHNLFVMSKRDDNSDYEEIFDESIENIETLNAPDMINKRKEFALTNTYANHIKKIATLIDSNEG